VKHPRLLGAFSFFTSVALIVALMQIPPSAGGPLTGSGFFAGAGLYGFVYGLCLGGACAKIVGWASFAAGCQLSLPVVLTTYGMALAGAPLVMAFAVVVAAGASFGGRVREGSLAA